MKNFLLIAVITIITIPSLSYADEGEFYVKVNSGWGKLTTVDAATVNDDSTTLEGGGEFKPEKVIFYGLGAGYYLMDNLRAEVIFDNYTKLNYKANNANDTISISEKLIVEASTIMLNGFVDLHEANSIKLFTGAGLGAANILGRYSMILKDNATNAQLPLDAQKFKTKTNFAYALYLGAMAQITSNVSGELTYSFKDLGSLKGGKTIFKKTPKFRGHYLSVGFSFSL